MIELGQLERRHEDFSRRDSRVIVVSVEGLDDARRTQADFPHLIVLSDQKHGLTNAAGLLHPHSAPDGGDTDEHPSECEEEASGRGRRGIPDRRLGGGRRGLGVRDRHGAQR